MIDYVKDKYGKNAVSQIATFGTMAPRPPSGTPGDGHELYLLQRHFQTGARQTRHVVYPGPSARGARRKATKTTTRWNWNLMLYERVRRKKTPRPSSRWRKARWHDAQHRHARRGVLGRARQLTDFCPLYQQPGSESAVSQYDKDDVEAIGLVKFDFLGHPSPSWEIARVHRQRHKGQENFAYENIPLDDRPTYRLFSEGKTGSGVPV